MSSMFTLVWSFRNRLPQIAYSLRSANALTPPDVPFILVDGNSDLDVVKNLGPLCLSGDRNIRPVFTNYRTTLWEAWNAGIMYSDTPYIIFASSDVLFTGAGWITPLRHYAELDHSYILLENHSVFAVSRKLVKSIGWFDEGFSHGGHADCDYMIRASEAEVPITVAPNIGYKHGDTPEETAARINGEVKDRLPFNDKTNEIYFKRKWKSDWPGWPDHIEPGQNLPHPPTHISQVTRQFEETDWHPGYRAKY